MLCAENGGFPPQARLSPKCIGPFLITVPVAGSNRRVGTVGVRGDCPETSGLALRASNEVVDIKFYTYAEKLLVVEKL